MSDKTKTALSARNIDRKEAEDALKYLQRQGMTLSGWLRVKIRELAELERERGK